MKKKWFERLKVKWKLGGLQVVLVLIVFACTGFTVLWLKKPILGMLMPVGDTKWWYSVLYYVFILPLYNIVLLIYGFLFGQFSFFWEFEKRTFSRFFGKKRK